MGVVTPLRLQERLARDNQLPACPTMVAFTVQVEIGGIGVRVLAQCERPDAFIAIDGCPITPGAPPMTDGRPGIWTRDRVAPHDHRLIVDLSTAAEAAETALQPVAHDVSASDAGMVFEIGGAARAACFSQVRENSHGGEVARRAVFDNMLRTLQKFAITWQG